MGKVGSSKRFFPLSFPSNISVTCFSPHIWNKPCLFMFCFSALPFPSLAHQHTRRLHFPKVQRGFFSPSISTCHTGLSQLRKRHSWNALPGFEHSLNSSCQSGACISCFRFFPGGFMLIHFTLLTHLFFSRLSYLFWAFKYICGEKIPQNFWLSLCSF